MQSEASRRTVFQEFHHALYLSASTIHRHVVFGGLLFHLPSGILLRATIQSSAWSCLNMWPIKFHLLLLISPLMLGVSAISSTVRFDMCSCHLTLRILYRYFVWEDLIFFFSVFVSFHVSHPYNNMERTTLLRRKTLTFLLTPEECTSHRYSPPDVGCVLHRPWWHWRPRTWRCPPPQRHCFWQLFWHSLSLLTFSTLHFLAFSFKPILAELSSSFVVLY